MAAYLVARIHITDPDQFSKYSKAVPRVIARYGGRYLARTADTQALEGQYDGRRLVMLEFPSVEAIHRFWQSPEYAEVKKLRVDAADLEAWAVPGV
jgi:uncharacterized protein (DUF1330 family)